MKKARPFRERAFADWRGGDLLSHANAHYHRRKPVSRSCSGWEGVVPGCYSRHIDGLPRLTAANKGGRNKALWKEIAPSAKITTCARVIHIAMRTVIGSSHTGN